MKQLTTTAIATGFAIVVLLFILKMIDQPLGGEPYTVLKIKERKEAETILSNQIKKEVSQKNQKITKEPEQKQPVYFKKSEADEKQSQQLEAAVKDGGDPGKLKEKQTVEIKNQLEYIARIGLPPAPNPDFIEQTKYGNLPRLSDDGQRPLDIYKRPTPALKRASKSIAIVITGLGLSQPLMETALEKLPPEVTFSFNPYAHQLSNWVRRTRSTGHELLLEVPLEPFDYPDNDPGPHTLLTHQSDRANLERLSWIMGRITGYIGFINLDGGKYISDENAHYALLREIKNRGLLYMDANPERPEMSQKITQEIKLEYANSTLIIDQQLNPKTIRDALKKLEQTASEHGQAIGIAAASPLIMKLISDWAETLKEKGITLVPLSANLPEKQS